jgi:PAS domain S-box-containing protein
MNNTEEYDRSGEEMKRQDAHALQQTEERFRLIANTAPIMIWMSGADKLCTYFNKAWLEFTGRSLEEEVGNGWTASVHPGDLSRVSETYTTAFDRREPYQVEYRLHHHNGGYRWILVSGVPRYDTDGLFGGYVGSCVDITDRKQVEEVRMRHSAIVQSSDDAILSKDCDGVIRSWNRGAQCLFGYTEAEAIGHPITIIIPDDLRDEERAILREVRNGGHIDHYETARITKEGKRVDVSISISPIRDSSGEIVSASSIARDVTERKRVEQSLIWLLRFEDLISNLSTTFVGLQEEEIDANIEQALRHLGEFLQLDQIALFQLSSDRAEMVRTYGWDKPEVMKVPFFVSTSDLPWWKRQMLSGEVSLVSKLEDLPEEASAEKEYLRQRGIASAASIPLKMGGKIDGAISFVAVKHQVVWTKDLVGQLRVVGDIFGNALKRKRSMEVVRESEERFRLVTNTAPVMIWMSGIDKLCTYFNKGWLEFTGRSFEQELGSGWTADVHPDDLAGCLETYSAAFEKHRPFRMQYRLRRNDGEYRWILNSGVAHFNADGSFAGYIGSCIDITERKQAEEALARVSHKLIEAHEEERTRIARELHDDINQRLALLALNLQQLERELPSHETQLRNRLGNEWKSVSELARDIQALSHRLHSSKLEYLGLQVAARSFCAEMAGVEEVQIDFHPENVPQKLSQEISLSLFRVLQEALQNAIKHSGSRTFQVSLTHEGKNIELTVRDSGNGFNPEDAKKGRGLGLISMQERLKLVGGQFAIYSRRGVGTTIRATVPFEERAEPPIFKAQNQNA